MESNQTPFAPDKPLDQDLLGYAPYVRAMANLISSPGVETPFSVGIFGPWGTGKTTFMLQLRQHLPSMNTVWFQPWMFDNKEEVWKALIFTILQYLERLDSERRTEAERQGERLINLFKGVGRLALGASIATLTANRADLDDLISFYSDTAKDNARFINTFRMEFEKLKDEILEGPENTEKRLVVFIDDLDRCTPEHCIVVLEAIKLFFDIKGCVFVLGIDREVVQKGIEVKYHRRMHMSGVDYLEKIIQLPFSLPPVAKETFRTFVHSITQEFGFSDQSVELVMKASDENPRRVKRLSNCLHLVRTVAKESSALQDGFDEGKLALLLVLQVRYPLAYRWLTRNANTLQELDKPAWKERHRPALIHALTESYGERVATGTADGFRQLMLSAHEDLKVKRFADPSELAAYLRISGVVDVSRPPSGLTMTEFVDEPLATPRLEEPEKPGPEAIPPPKEPPRGIPTNIHGAYTETISSWEKLRQKTLPDIWISRISRLEHHASEIVSSARMTSEFLLDLKEESEESHFERRQMLSKLKSIQMSVFFRQLTAAGVSLMSAGVGFGLALSYFVYLWRPSTSVDARGYLTDLIAGNLTTESTIPLFIALAPVARGFLIWFRGSPLLRVFQIATYGKG